MELAFFVPNVLTQESLASDRPYCRGKDAFSEISGAIIYSRADSSEWVIRKRYGTRGIDTIFDALDLAIVCRGSVWAA